MAYDYVYDFTNENVGAYPSLYDFEGKSVLTVLGSGDQYFTALLNGAKKVDVIDVNEFAWYYFVLKFNAIKHFSYDEFYNFFITSGLDSISSYERLRDYLPSGVTSAFDHILSNGLSLSSIKVNGPCSITPAKDDGSVIPYFSRENYYLLQELLNKTSLPTFFPENFMRFSEKETYDLTLLSNIADYLNCTISDFKRKLAECNCPTFQALYAWDKPKDIYEEFEKAGFQIDFVPTSSTRPKRFNPEGKDAVLSLRK